MSKRSNTKTLCVTLDPAFVAEALKFKPPFPQSDEDYLARFISHGNFDDYKKQLQQLNEDTRQRYRTLGLVIEEMTTEKPTPERETKPEKKAAAETSKTEPQK